MRELLCGRNTVFDAIENKLPLKIVYATKNIKIKTGDFILKIVEKSFLDKLTKENHQGIAAELKEFNYYDLQSIIKDKPKKVLILDHVQDPRNLGAIMRSANAFGVKHIILPKDRAAKITVSALKTSSGGYVGLKIIRVNSLVDAVTKLKKEGFWIYASALEGGIEMKYVTFNDPTVLILGNEGKGVSKTLLKQADQKVFIKMEGTVQSLNVSVAAGIFLQLL